MKLLVETRGSRRCAGLVMDVALLATRLMRSEIRRSRPANLSLQQVRALATLDDAPDAPLSHVADHLGLALSSASHLIEGMVRRGLVRRRPLPRDRRHVRLHLTAKGARSLQHALAMTRADLERRLAPLDSRSRALVTDALRRLRPVLAAASSASP